jgi:hypothetical protein
LQPSRASPTPGPVQRSGIPKIGTDFRLGPKVKKSDSDKWALGRTIPIFARESTLYKIIVDHFLQDDPEKRSSLDEILALDYFKGDVFKEEELLELVDNL